MVKKRNVEKKITRPKNGVKKQCLGPDCEKWILATPAIRLCAYCRKRISDIESESGIFIENYSDFD